ncbi:glycogen debranching N-terminal domain-containing protein [Actinophytocola sediminis]
MEVDYVSLFLTDLVTVVCAPAAVLSAPDGQLRPPGAAGWLVADVRHLHELTVLVDGAPPRPIGHWQTSAASQHFVGAVPTLGVTTGDQTVRLERRRTVTPTHLHETIDLVNDARTEVTATMRVRLAADLAPILAVRHDHPTPPVPPVHDGKGVAWTAGSCATTASTDRPADRVEVTADRLALEWDLLVPARGRGGVTITLHATGGTEDAVVTAPASRDLGPLRVTSREPELDRLVATGLDDLRALLLADPAAPADRFAGAGAPWYFTLFGRDSLWTARFALPLGTDLALGTLRTLARRQGTRHDRETAEEPGKILHEIRQLATGLARRPGLPPCYYGTVDATPLWISLLHDAWRWGLPAADIEPLLPALRRALDWILAHGDGFLAYRDESGRGLANQGWKDSPDAIQDSAGTIASAPIVLSEAQAYAHRAVLDAAAVLTAFNQRGAAEATAFAAGLRARFRKSFWVNGFPAIALDGAGRPVDTIASNLGHLLGTGLLTAAEESTVAAQLPVLDSGFGLHTMSPRHPSFNPIGYHTGSVWPHDTAIAIAGLAGAGQHALAAALAGGLVAAGTRFDHRLPELYGGWPAAHGRPLPFPSACRPQAWAAASAFVLVRVALGLAADVPAGRLRVAPAAAFADWFPLRVDGLSVAGHALSVEVDRDGRASVRTEAEVEIDA